MAHRQPSYDEIFDAVRALEPALEPSDRRFQVAIVCLAGAVVPHLVYDVRRFTGYRLEFVGPVVRRLRDQGIWRDGTVPAAWFGEGGGLAFWLDVAVAEGLLDRVSEGVAS